MLMRLLALGACLMLAAHCQRRVACKALDEHHQEESAGGGADEQAEHHSTGPAESGPESGPESESESEATSGPEQGDGEEAAESSVDPVQYLGEFGYIDKKEVVGDWNSLAEDVFENAIREFQRFVNITETGKVDALTKEYMAKNRCGNKDIDKAEALNGRNGTFEDPLEVGDERAEAGAADESGEGGGLERVRRHLRRHRRYALMGTKWPRMTVTYKTTRYSSHKRVKRADWDRTVARAFEAWASVAPLKFERRDSGKVDIELSFVKGQHEGCENELKDKSTVLAHAYQPGKSPINGDIHFNDYHKWTTSLRKDGGLTPVMPVAIHEIGHSLGVDHSHIKKAIMFPMNQGHLALDADDKRAINELYGDKKRRAGGPSAKPAAPTTSTKRPAGAKPAGPKRPGSTSRPRTGPSARPRAGKPPGGGGGVIVGGAGDGVLLVPEPNDGPGAGPGIHVGVDRRLVACGGAFFARGPSCRQFFDCTAPLRRLKFCPPGLFWRQSRLWCDFPHNVPECDYEVDPVADSPAFVYPGQPPLVGGGIVTINESGGPDASTDEGQPKQGDGNESQGEPAQEEPNQAEPEQGEGQAGPQGDDGTHGDNHDSDAHGGGDTQGDEQSPGELNSGAKKPAKMRQ